MKSTYLKKTALAVAIASTWTVGQPLAIAQEERISLEEVIVTARKRQESMQDIPVSVTALDEQLQRSTLQTLADVQGYVPNVNINKGGQSNTAIISIRGISFQDPDKSMESPVGVILDGVYMGTIAGGLLNNFDMERIEVLRGPQGTLFGKNTTAGALNIVRSGPTKEWGAKVRIGGGSWDRKQIQGVINVPLTERGGLKLYGNKDEHDGYMDNPATREEVGAVDFQQLGGTIAFDITDKFDVSFTAERIEDESDAGVFSNINGIETAELSCLLSLDPSPGGLAAISGAPVGSGCMELDRSDEDNSTADKSLADVTTDYMNLTMNWEISPDWLLTSITGSYEKDEEMLLDYDGSEVDFLSLFVNHDYEQFSQELRVNGAINDNLNLTAGVYYWDSEYDQFQESYHLWYYLGFSALPPSDVTQPLDGAGTNESIALFASVDWQISDNWLLNLGGRYTEEERTLTTQVPGFYSQLLDVMIVPNGPVQKFKEDWNEFSPRVALQYSFNDDLMMFGSFSSGFKSGGFFARTQNVNDIRSFDPEYVDTWELGIKSEWLDNRVRFNATAFYSEYEDKQEESVIDLGGGNVTTIVYNAADAEIAGLELELAAQITAGLSGFLNFGFLDAEYKDFFAAGVDVSDRELRNAPEQTVGVGLDYNANLGFGELGLHYNYHWRDEFHTVLSNDERGLVDSGGFHNASIDLTFAENYKLSVYGRNIGDERFQRAVPIGISGWGNPNQPEHYGVEFTVEF